MQYKQQISLFQVKNIEKDGVFTGYASVFDYVDLQNDQVMPGAFAKSLQAWRSKNTWPKMLWQHDYHHPIGTWLDIHEDTKGLKVHGQLLLDIHKGREAYILLKHGVTNGLSIGFSLEHGTTSPKGHQLLHVINLHEVSLVTYAANELAKVEWCKQQDRSTNKGVLMSNPSSQTAENITEEKMQYKALERPALEGRNHKMHTKTHDFIKHGEKALSSQDGAGSLVLRKPEITEILAKPQSPTLFRQIAGLTTVNSDHLEIVKQMNNADSGWANEMVMGDETRTAELRKITIPVYEMYARTQISQRLIDDAVVDLESWLMTTVNQRFESLEEEAFINGNGNNMPKGFLDYEKVAVDLWEWGKLAEMRTGRPGTIVNADILLDTVSSLKTPYLASAVWVMSRSAFSDIRRLKEPATGHYLWQPNLHEGGNSLLGYPIIISDVMPALRADQATTPIAFGSFKQGYHIVDRGEFTILRDPFSVKPLVEFYITQRVGGDVIDFEAIKLITVGE